MFSFLRLTARDDSLGAVGREARRKVSSLCGARHRHVRHTRDPEHRVVRRASSHHAADCVVVVVVVVVVAASVVVELGVECEWERTETAQTDAATWRRTRVRFAVEARTIRGEPL
jgi:hypothetical protein